MPLATAPPPAAPPRHSPVGRVAAAAATAGAGLVHLAVVPAHLHEYAPFGIFFALAGAGQLAVAVAVLRGRLLRGAVAAQVLLALLWVVSRTVGLPVGPSAWAPEEIGVADVVCVALELLAAAVLVGLAARGARPRPGHWPRTPVLAALAAVPVALATVVGVGTGLSGMPDAVSVAPPTGDPGATSVTALVAPSGPQPVRAFTLTAREAVVDGRPAMTYDGTVPGPLLRVRVGDRVRVTLVNHLRVATTLHWHGLRVPAAADGVAGVTQDAVAPGASFTSEFVAGEAGTFWYHSHQDTGAQIAAGLFGALVVDPPGGPRTDVDTTVLLHDGGAGAVLADGSAGDRRVAARPGQTVRLRVIDAVAPGMDGTAEAPVLLGAPYRVVALDGRDVAGPQPLGPRRLRLGMGQRVDLEFTMPPAGAVRLVDSRVAGTPSLLQGFFGAPARADETVTFGEGPLPAVDPAAVPLFDPLTYGTPVPDPTLARPSDVNAPVVLGERPGFRDGRIELVHTIDGAAAPDVPPIVVRPGQLVGLHLVNDTSEFHPMHLHGHVMTVVSVDGRRPTGSPIHLDTVTLAPHESADVVFPADNPGLWMLHCHVPLHAAMGMSTTVVYAGVTTPFTMGGDSGNMPE